MTQTKTQNSIKDISLYSKYVPWPLIKWGKKKPYKSILKYFQRPCKQEPQPEVTCRPLCCFKGKSGEEKAKMMSFPKTFTQRIIL